MFIKISEQAMNSYYSSNLHKALEETNSAYEDDILITIIPLLHIGFSKLNTPFSLFVALNRDEENRLSVNHSAIYGREEILIEVVKHSSDSQKGVVLLFINKRLTITHFKEVEF